MLKRICFIILFLMINLSFLAQASDEMMENLQQRINDLTDQIEKINHKYDVLMKKFETLAADVEFRLKESEKNKINAEKTAEPVKKKSLDPKHAKLEFEKAYALIKDQQYNDAEQAFTEFVSSYPNSEYTGAAYYWLGESFMLRKRYDKAAINYIHSFSKFPKNAKADLSMLKLARALNMLGKKKEACSSLANLKAKNSSLSPAMQKLLARELAQLSCK